MHVLLGCSAELSKYRKRLMAAFLIASKEHYVNYHQNTANKGSSLQLCYFILCTLILTLTSLRHGFFGFIILQDIYIPPFTDL